jgi:hypothetical protein
VCLVRALGMALVAAAAAAAALTPTAGAAPLGPAQQLVRAYSPIVMLREQTDVCDDTEEQYEPTTVYVMLGNPRVRLLGPKQPDGRRVVKRAPSAADVVNLGPDYHLDVPGDALNPGCTYAKDFRALKQAGRAPPITYAHIATEPGRPGLVVQYWFFYDFNQFNDVHEGDWEGMQIAFDASSAEQALAKGPSQIALFQHGGGEKADWDDDRVEKEGTHPVVYPAAGSHATFFEPAVYVENGQGGSGLGCDNTTEPLRRVRPTPVLIPDQPGPGTQFQWLTYFGHWGEKQKGYNNGPTGPLTKSQWDAPYSWMDGLRSASPELPGGSLMGPAVTNVFCGTVATLSTWVNLEAKSRTGAVLLLVGVLVLVALPIVLTRWRPVDLSRLRERRAFGQLVRAAAQLYRRHWRPLLLIGLTAIPIIGAVEGLHWVVRQLAGGNQIGIGSASSDFALRFDDPIAAVGRPVGFAVVGAAVITFVCELDAGRRASFVTAYRGAFERFWRAAFCQLLAELLVIAMFVTVIGIPFAVLKYIDWQFVQQEVMFRNASFREAFRASTRLVRGHWWHTVSVAGFFWLLARIVGPVLGFGLIFANLSLPLIDFIGAVVFALLVPYVAVGRTLLYFDLAARHETARAPRWRRGARRLGLGGPRPAPAIPPEASV